MATKKKTRTKPKANAAFTGLQAQVGSDIKRMRIKRGMEQQELAKKAGVHRTLIVSLEGGNGNTSLKTLCKLVQALDAKVSINIKPVHILAG